VYIKSNVHSPDPDDTAAEFMTSASRSTTFDEALNLTSCLALPVGLPSWVQQQKADDEALRRARAIEQAPANDTMQKHPAAAMGISADDLMRASMAEAARLGKRGGGHGRGHAGRPPAGGRGRGHGRGRAARANDIAVEEQQEEEAAAAAASSAETSVDEDAVEDDGSSEAEQEAPVAEAGVQTRASRRICPMPQD